MTQIRLVAKSGETWVRGMESDCYDEYCEVTTKDGMLQVFLDDELVAMCPYDNLKFFSVIKMVEV